MEAPCGRRGVSTSLRALVPRTLDSSKCRDAKRGCGATPEPSGALRSSPQSLPEPWGGRP
eukprot:1840195-Alexandrium_andersonii.AAC.1